MSPKITKSPLKRPRLDEKDLLISSNNEKWSERVDNHLASVYSIGFKKISEVSGEVEDANDDNVSDVSKDEDADDDNVLNISKDEDANDDNVFNFSNVSEDEDANDHKVFNVS